MFYIVQSDERPDGWAVLSTANSWLPWLAAIIPCELAPQVRHRLQSNLKHVIVGLELKAALIRPHHDEPGVLFEPYFQNLISDFCVGAYSVLEGLGAAHWLHQNDQSGADAPFIHRNHWRAALCVAHDANGARELHQLVDAIQSARDRLHQDRLGLRADIDWHAFTYEAAFFPAAEAIKTLLVSESELVPATSNLA